LMMVEHSMGSGSQWLGEAAYAQVTRLESVPKVVEEWILGAVMRLALERRLRRQWQEMKAFLLRLPKPIRFLNAARLLLCLPFVDAALCLAACISAWLTWRTGVREHHWRFILYAVSLLASLPLTVALVREFDHVVRVPRIEHGFAAVPLALIRAFAFILLISATAGSKARPEWYLRLFRSHQVSVVLITYCALWAPFALLVFDTRDASPPIRWSWIQLPFSALLRPRRFLKALKRILGDLLETVELLGSLVRHSAVKRPDLTIAICSSIVVLGVLLALFPGPTRWALGIAFGLALSLGLLRVLLTLSRDIRKCRRIMLSKELTAKQAVQAWASLEFAIPRTMLIQYATQRGLLPNNEESQRLMHGLTLLLEQDIELGQDSERRGTDSPTATSGVAGLDKWYRAYVTTDRDRLRNWGIQALDELCRLEQKLSEGRR